MGLSGARSLLLVVPVVMAGSAGSAVARIAAFGLGIVVAMAATGWPLRAAATLEQTSPPTVEELAALRALTEGAA